MLIHSQSAAVMSLLVLVLVGLCGLSLLPGVHSVTSCQSFPQYQYYALKDLYDSTQGQNWHWIPDGGAHWNFTDPNVNPCNEGWQGLNCTSACYIHDIGLSGFNLTGTLPDSLGMLNTIQNFTVVGSPKLQGSLPSTLSNWTQIIYVDVQKNSLTGTFPSFITESWLKIKSLTLSYNKFHGTIPTTINLLQHLTLLNLRNNSWSGTLPSTLTTMPLLNYISVKYNKLTGTIPSDLGNLTHLVVCDFSYNSFTKTIPTSITTLKRLEVFYAYFNLLTGTIPSSLNSITKLLQFSVNNNKLQGTLPPFGSLTNLALLRADNNSIVGTIPDCFHNLNQLGIFNMTYNHLTGTLPTSLQYATALLSFDVSLNKISGHVNNIFVNASGLNQLILYSNRFSGNLDSIVNPMTQNALTAIDVSNNHFHGTISPEIFMLRNLTLFAAVKNCFTGTLPQAICLTNRTMETLVLDGLHTQINCQRRIFPGVRTYLITSPVHGSVPGCLFTDMRKLTLLHLSGNGLEGTVPSTPPSPSLMTLSLAHNRFTGSIPTGMQERSWTLLDLSFNKFTGFIADNIDPFSANNATLHLENNRLSGQIPSQLKQAKNLDILGGNLFECDVAHTQLPPNDPHANSYECASTSTDDAIYTWITFFLLLVTLYFSKGFLIKTFSKDNSLHDAAERFNIEMGKWWVVYSNFTPRNKNMFEFGLIMREVRRWSMRMTILVVLVFIPTYSVLTTLYGTYTKQYAWTISIAYLSGFRPAIVMMFLLLLLLLALYSPTNKFLLINFFRVGKRVKKKMKLILQFYFSQFDVNDDDEEALKRMGTAKREEVEAVRKMLEDMDKAERKEEMEKEMSRSRGVFGRRDSKRVTSEELSNSQKRSSRRISVERERSRSRSRSGDDVDNGDVTKVKEEDKNDFSQKDLDALMKAAKGDSEDKKEGENETDGQDGDISILERPSVEIEPVKFSIQDAKTFYRWYALIGALSVVNVALVIVVNMAYVASISDNRLNSYSKETLSFSVSVFKLIWNGTIMDMMYYYIHAELLKIKEATHQERLSKRSLLLPLMLWLSIFNNIIVPFIAVAFISPNCFYYAIYPDSNVESTISFNGCTENIRQSGTGYITVLNCNAASQPYSINYSPPFAYSFQCTSSLLSSFTDIFLYRYILGGAVVPIGMMVLKFIQEYVLLRFGWESELFHLISIAIPAELRPLQRPPPELQGETGRESMSRPASTAIAIEEGQGTNTNASEEGRQSSASVFMPNVGLSRETSKRLVNDSINNITGIKNKIQNIKIKDINKMLGLSADSDDNMSFGLYSSIIMFATDIAILLTFGTMFPPLAVIGCFTIYIRTFYMQLTLGRIIHLSKNQPYLRKLVDALNDECMGIAKLLMSCLLSLPLLLSCLWSWFLFDIWGDRTGFNPAYYIVMCLPLIPLLFLPIVFPLIQTYLVEVICPAKHNWDKAEVRGKAPRIVSTTVPGGSIQLNDFSVALAIYNNDHNKDSVSTLNPMVKGTH